MVVTAGHSGRIVFVLLSLVCLVCLVCIGCFGCAASPHAVEPEADPWRRFTRQLADASALIHAPGTPDDPVTTADGYQVLPRLLRLAWEHADEYADPEAPILFKSTDAYLTNGW